MHLQGTEKTIQKSCEEDQTTEVPDGIVDLQKIQSTIQAVEKVMVEEMEKVEIDSIEKAMEEKAERHAVRESVDTNIKVAAESEEETEELKSRSGMLREEGGVAYEEMNYSDDLDLKKTKAENGILMKDIQLDQVSDCSLYGRSRRKTGGIDDQMLVLWESAEQDRTQNAGAADDETQNQESEPNWASSSGLQAEKELGIDKLEVSFNKLRNQEGNKGKMLERLASDAQKLTSLHRSVQDLKKKMEMNKRSKKCNFEEFEMVQRQLLEVEEAVVQLVGVHDQLTKDVEETGLSSSNGKSSAESEEDGNIRRKRVTEQARKGAEKIGQLQFELQNIHYILLKLEDENKSKGKTTRFSESKTGVLLRDFIYSSRRRRQRRRKGCFCGCSRPSTRED